MVPEPDMPVTLESLTYGGPVRLESLTYGGPVRLESLTYADILKLLLARCPFQVILSLSVSTVRTQNPVCKVVGWCRTPSYLQRLAFADIL
jgi:hypothetical protein